MFQTNRQLRQRIKWQRETIEDLYERLEDLTEDYVDLIAEYDAATGRLKALPF
jgi:hypothetical protein